MKDVVLNLTGVTQELPFRNYYEQRNGTVARLIAEYLERKYLGEVQILGGEHYVVPPKTITKETAAKYGITGTAEFYGGAVEHLDHAGKAILHPTVSKDIPVPQYYSHTFAHHVDSDRFVLPGFTVFTVDDAQEAYAQMARRGHKSVRVKKTMESGGLGQKTINSMEELLEFIARKISAEELNTHGLVLEAAVKNPRTVSVGYAVLGESIVSFVANQKNGPGEEGTDRYLGARVKVIRGPMQNFSQEKLDEIETKSVTASVGFFRQYSYFNPVLSRISFDAINGKGSTGEELCGVSDITARLGGTCPALILSALELKNHPELKMIESEVTLNYDPHEERQPEEEGGTDFIDLPSLRITARINKTHE